MEGRDSNREKLHFSSPRRRRGPCPQRVTL